MAGVFQLFSVITDIETGNPDAWVNWFGARDQVGRLYKHADKSAYFEVIENKLITNGAGGRVIFAKVTYNVYDDYIWDADENRYMGVVKLGKFTELIDYDARTSLLEKEML